MTTALADIDDAAPWVVGDLDEVPTCGEGLFVVGTVGGTGADVTETGEAVVPAGLGVPVVPGLAVVGDPPAGGTAGLDEVGFVADGEGVAGVAVVGGVEEGDDDEGVVVVAGDADDV